MTAVGALLGSGRVADVYEYGTHVLKLYRSPGQRATAFAEAACLAVVGSHGLPVPAVHGAGSYEGRWGLVMDRAPGECLATIAQSRPDTVPAVLDEMVRLHLQMHGKVETRLRSLKSRLAASIAGAPQLDDALRTRLRAALATLPDGDRICHGDFHPLNIVGPIGSGIIVDWPDVTSGPPAADVCRSYLLLRQVVPEIAELYLDRYVRLGRLDRAEILAWLPVVAAARLAEGIEAENASLLQLAAAVA